MRRETNLIKAVGLFISIVIILNSCNDEKEEYYKRPEWLAPTIYIQLEEKGNYTSLLKCIDKAGYKDILGKSGYYTFFAANDAAFTNFLQDNGLSSVDDIDSTLAKEIVTFNLVYNAYKKERLDDYQSIEEEGWVPDIAFKRQTAYSKWVYPEVVDGEEILVADQNGVTKETGGAIYNSEDKNNKHISYFTDEYMGVSDLTVEDYNYFFPESDFTGFNVLGAKVTEPDVLAENGIIHYIDKVLTPLPNLEDFIGSKPEYSLFKSIIDTFNKQYYTSAWTSNQYYLSTGISEDVYVKYYQGILAPPNCENYFKYDALSGGERFDAQTNGWSIFVPTNEAIEDFFDDKFLKHYNSLDEMNDYLIQTFINTHTFQTMVWPSKFDVTASPYGETPRFDINTDVVDHQYASNGVFYGVNKIQESDVFYTLFGDIILDPDYALMWEALKTAEMEGDISGTRVNYTVFMLPNEVFEKIGLTHDGSSWQIDNPDLGTNATTAVIRLIKLHIIENESLNEEDLTGNKLIKTSGTEYIKVNNPYVWAAGNTQQGIGLAPIKKRSKKEGTNGISYVLEQTPITFSTNNVGVELEGVFGSSVYMKYLRKTAETHNGIVYNATTFALANVKTSIENTILVPSDEAMQAAVDSALIPPITASDFTDDQVQEIYRFVMYHVINGAILTNNGEGTGKRGTLYSTVDGKTYVDFINTNNEMTFYGAKGNEVRVVDDIQKMNVLSNRAVIHQVDFFMDYRTEE